MPRQPEPVVTPLTADDAEKWAAEAIEKLAPLPDTSVCIKVTGTVVMVSGDVPKKAAHRYNQHFNDPREREITFYSPNLDDQRDETFSFSLGFGHLEGKNKLLEHLCLVYAYCKE